MVYTEEEAKGKYCYLYAAKDLYAAKGAGQQQLGCIASSCMAWRWIHDYLADRTQTKNGAQLGTCNIINPRKD